MYQPIVDIIRGEISGERVTKEIAEIVARDRWFTYPKFQETARYAAKQFRRSGLGDVEILQFPADGKTLFGTWRAGPAWDATAATLTVLGPGPLAGRVLADYQAVACSLGMWSAPTPKGGIDAEIINVGGGTRDEDYAGKNIRGNIILTSAMGTEAKALAAKHGAIGILSDWNSQPRKNPDAVGWHNAFADAQGGWPLTANCSRMFRFGITPRVGAELRSLLAAGEKIRVHAVVKSRIYAGEFPVVTAAIPGTKSGEILILAHAFEQGAKDNASGVACMIEAVRTLAKLINSGKLPRPRRTIRALVTNECFGTIGYVERFPRRARQTLAAINLDEVGVDKNSVEVQSLFGNPQSSASFLDTFMQHLAGNVWKTPHFNPFVTQPYNSSDNFIALSSIGIPAIWMGCHGSRITWHNTRDVPECMAPGQLKSAATYAAVYLYFLANAGAAEAGWLAGLAASEAKRDMEQEQIGAHARWLAAPKSQQREILDALGQRLVYLIMVHDAAIDSVLTFSPKATKTCATHRAAIRNYAADLFKTVSPGSRRALRPGIKIVSPFDTPLPAEARTVIPACAFPGPIAYDPIPADKREGHLDPRWMGPVNVALAWSNAKRTLAEICALAEHELNKPLPGVAEEILWLVPKGLVRDLGGAATRRRGDWATRREVASR